MNDIAGIAATASRRWDPTLAQAVVLQEERSARAVGRTDLPDEATKIS